MVTTTSTEIIGDYVHVVLSTGEEIDINVSWSNIPYDDTRSLLQYELEQAPIRAQARIDQATADAQAAQDQINSI